jgi:hypothetical protein
MNEAMQMTTAQAVGAASHTAVVHAIRNSSQAGRPIAEEACSPGTRTRLDSFAGGTRAAACSRSELFAAQEAGHHRSG